MRTLMAVMVATGMMVSVGCDPYRVSVRSDGVMAMPGGIIYDPRTEKVLVVKPPDGEQIWGMEWSPDGKRLLIEPGDVKDANAKYWIASADGKDFKEVAAQGLIHHWTPDGKGISFVAVEQDKQPKLMVTEIETGKTVTVLESALMWYCWHPSGDGVAAFEPISGLGKEHDEGGIAQLVGVGAGEKDKAGLIVAYANPPWITWSKDGETVLFTAPAVTMPRVMDKMDEETKKKLQSEVGLYAFDGGTKEVVRLTERKIGYAEYSPDGKHILFVELVGEEKTRVGVMKADGTGVVELDEGAEAKNTAPFGAALFQPVWVSNARVLYFRSTTDLDIWEIDIDGKNKEDLGAKIKKLVEALPKEEPRKPAEPAK